MPTFQNVTRALAGAALSLGLLTGAAHAQSKTVDSDFAVYGVKWNNGGETAFIYTLGESGGKTIVCGIYFNDGPVPEIAVRKMLQSGSVRVGRSAIVSNLSFFKNASGTTNLKKVKAPCRVSRKAWQAGYAAVKPTLRFPRKVIEF